MTDKNPVKKGVLSGLMGLFGDEEAEARPTTEAPATDDSASMRAAALPPESPRPSEVVREAYEPGWYRISAAMPSATRDADEQDDHGEAEAPIAEEEPVASDGQVEQQSEEQPVAEQPVAEEEPSPEAQATAGAATPELVTEEHASVLPTPDFVWDPPFDQSPQEVQTVDVSTPESPPAEAVPESVDEVSVTVEPAPAADGDPRFHSRDPADRRAALESVTAAGIDEENAATIVAMLRDPDRDIRALALEALGSAPDLVDPWTLREAMQDPVDDVRAAAVRLASRRHSADVSDALVFVAERHWPLAQQAALESMPALVVRTGIPDEALYPLLSAIGRMESHPLPYEHGGLAALARAIGPSRLAESLGAGDRVGLGAARLLLEEGSAESLSALAERSDEGDPEMQLLISQAVERRGASEPRPAAEPEPEAVQPAESPAADAEPPPPSVEEDMLTGLARALEDPGPSVRERAREALGGLPHDQVAAWVGSALASDDPERARLGAEVAGAARLLDLAPAMVERALTSQPDAQPGFVRALTEMAIGPEFYSELLRSASSERRPDAVRLVWQVGGRTVLPHFHQFLDDPSAQVRVAALEVIGESGDPAAIETARSILERDSSPVVRATAISVIGRAGLDQREASLARALADPDPDVRAMAVEVLPTGMAGRAAHLLLQALSDEDERVWQAAVRHLAEVPERDRGVVWTAIVQGPAHRREEVLAALERAGGERLASLALEHLTDPDPTVRTLAITLAGRSGTAEGARVMASALQDPAPAVRRAAALAIAGLRAADSIPALAGCLYDPDVEVRVDAVRGLAEIDNDDVLTPLISALKDPEVRVREVASDALIRWQSPAVARRLAVALTQPSLRRQAADALARMGMSAVEPLVDLLLEEKTELSETVGALLRELAGPDRFLERLGAMDAAERLRAVEVLGAMGDDHRLEGLTRALSDPVEGIRIRAVTLLGESRDPRAFDAVKRTFLGDPVEEVVAAAEDALKKLQPGS